MGRDTTAACIDMDFGIPNTESDEELKQRAREYALERVCAKFKQSVKQMTSFVNVKIAPVELVTELTLKEDPKFDVV